MANGTVKVALTEDWANPLGGFTEVPDTKRAYEWIAKAVKSGPYRKAGYTRSIFDTKTKSIVVDFGDYRTFGLIRFETVDDMYAGTKEKEAT